MRAIVENQQHALITQRGCQAGELVLGLQIDVDRVSHRTRHESRIGQPREVDAPDTTLVVIDQTLGSGHCDGGLSDPARADEGDQAHRGNAALQLGHEIIPSDQGGETR